MPNREMARVAQTERGSRKNHAMLLCTPCAEIKGWTDSELSVRLASIGVCERCNTPSVCTDLPPLPPRTQITFRLDGTAEYIGDQTYPAATLVQGSAKTARASHVEPVAFWLRLAFHLARKCGLTAWTRRWGCYWRVRVVGGPTLPGVYKNRDTAIHEEVRWLEEHRL